jgi:hypothetical protein
MRLVLHGVVRQSFLAPVLTVDNPVWDARKITSTCQYRYIMNQRCKGQTDLAIHEGWKLLKCSWIKFCSAWNRWVKKNSWINVPICEVINLIRTFSLMLVLYQHYWYEITFNMIISIWLYQPTQQVWHNNAL